MGCEKNEKCGVLRSSVSLIFSKREDDRNNRNNKNLE